MDKLSKRLFQKPWNSREEGGGGEVNAKTKLALKDLATAVQKLAAGTVHMLGTDECGQIIEAAETLKDRLDKDETLVD